MAVRPSQRRRLFRGVLYGVFAAVLLAAGFAVDWDRIRFSFFQPDVLREMLPEVLVIAGRNTLIYTAGSFVLGLVLALILALMKLSTIKPYRWFATAYVEFFRGLPALITVIVFGFGLPIAFDGFRVPGGTLGTGSVALGVVAAAYMAETIRAGVLAVPRGQTEAARSLGMSASRAMVSIVLPQAFRIIIPPLTNEFVILVKDTSLVVVLGLTLSQQELLSTARDIYAQTFNATPFLAAAAGYLAITLPMIRIVTWLERKLRSGLTGIGA